MREIIFRGKPTGSVMNEEDLQDCMFDIVDGFVYGNLITDEHEPTIVGKVVDSDWDYCSMEWWCPVIKETVGQFTGLLDKHGRKIFEGDILHEPYRKTKNVIVTYKDGNFHLVPVGIYSASSSGELSFCKQNIDYFKYKIIGNIYDNSDLMKEIIK